MSKYCVLQANGSILIEMKGIVLCVNRNAIGDEFHLLKKEI